MPTNLAPQLSAVSSKLAGASPSVSLLPSLPVPLHLAVTSIRPSQFLSPYGKASPGKKYPTIYFLKSSGHSWQECCLWACTGTYFGATVSYLELELESQDMCGSRTVLLLLRHCSVTLGFGLKNTADPEMCVGRKSKHSRPRHWRLGSRWYTTEDPPASCAPFQILIRRTCKFQFCSFYAVPD